MLRQRGRPYLFSNSVAPPIIGATMAAFELLKDPSHVTKLKNNTVHFRTAMSKAGFKILGHAECPIVPVWLGDAKLAAYVRLLMK